jgi:hypothetical protein
VTFRVSNHNLRQEFDGAIGVSGDFVSWMGVRFRRLKDAHGDPVLNPHGLPCAESVHSRVAWVQVEVWDDDAAVEPLATRQSAVVELPLGTTIDTERNAAHAGSPDVAGLFSKERLGFSIPMPPRERPYVVKVKVVRGQPAPVKVTDKETGRTGVRDLSTTQAGRFDARVK